MMTETLRWTKRWNWQKGYKRVINIKKTVFNYYGHIPAFTQSHFMHYQSRETPVSSVCYLLFLGIPKSFINVCLFWLTRLAQDEESLILPLIITLRFLCNLKCKACRKNKTRVMYRGRRAIDVATMAAVTMAARTAADKSTAAKEGRSEARSAGDPQRATDTASRAAWARRRRGSRCAPACGLAPLAAPSAAGPCARGPCIAASHARAPPLSRGDTLTPHHSLTDVHTNLSRAEGNSISWLRVGRNWFILNAQEYRNRSNGNDVHKRNWNMKTPQASTCRVWQKVLGCFRKNQWLVSMDGIEATWTKSGHNL